MLSGEARVKGAVKRKMGMKRKKKGEKKIKGWKLKMNQLRRSLKKVMKREGVPRV